MSYPYLSDVIKDLTGIDLPLPIATFGLLVACAILAGGECLKRELARLYAAERIGPAHKRVKGEDGVVSEVAVPPQEIVNDLSFIVVLVGVVGARLFHILEHTDQFMADPWSMIFSRSGLSVFGGLILGTVAGVICVRRWKLPIRPLLDAVAPAMMLGYALGRIGCQVSGDGDWGTAANMALKPDWLPTWFWAQTYDNNIFGEVLAAPGVYPTSIYETVMALACFGLLWALRKHRFLSGWLFSVYLVLAGLERLLIEQIRVNPKITLGGLQASQAEIVAVVLTLAGLLGLALLSRRVSAVARPIPAAPQA
ncbi:prolipoprotein diacylglyceryl transferase [Massilia antarctica]|uniref:prolipoprotein diacylglyceryl transferase n=1 Tax=Massilia antarctica TaxID=2765360 RepID=UPI0006BB691F|nr:prolipoprotein diacylglyceryl transferase [Massilia sp. H27-R4]MCY0913153.1 prolipoprotein diacylglyceryl transferase [Massilia sp. H27-R4]CUI07754.1 Prolipoprotein diacylglyceryl transferase [Janthinobacterium sp. CG23_2]CUU31540.1 Prolipoprotein diacylglyceryl transferase [Janthinobacterium sp. CG23_2]